MKVGETFTVTLSNPSQIMRLLEAEWHKNLQLRIMMLTPDIIFSTSTTSTINEGARYCWNGSDLDLDRSYKWNMMSRSVIVHLRVRVMLLLVQIQILIEMQL